MHKFIAFTGLLFAFVVMLGALSMIIVLNLDTFQIAVCVFALLIGLEAATHFTVVCAEGSRPRA